MPWSEGPVEERRRMMMEWEAGATVSELAEAYGVSRQTVYTWINRYQSEGTNGLEERSRAPHSSPLQTSMEVTHALLDVKEKRPRWGPHKLVRLLADQGMTLSASTARDILQRNGLVRTRRTRPRLWAPSEQPAIVVPGVGHTMTADHKGQFRMGDGRYCFPLTIADPASRYVFAVEGASSTSGALAAPVFERVFREWGLPEQIVTDNGAPFCARGIGGLSHLSKQWLKLGIRHVRIQPGRPQQNGRHERMHRTLKDETTRPPESNMRQQQKRFNAFVREFNHERPHQALGQQTPVSRVQRYRREFTGSIPEPDYPASWETRTVRSNGEIKWTGGLTFVGEVLIGERVSLCQVADGLWQLYFASAHIADWDERTKKFIRAAANN